MIHERQTSIRHGCNVKYPEIARRAIYTTNAVEVVHRQLRKLTETKRDFANEISLPNLLYAGKLKSSERWTHPVRNRKLTLSQLTIHLPGLHLSGRLGGHINLCRKVG